MVSLGIGVVVALTGCSDGGIGLDTSNEMTYRLSAATVSQTIENPDTREVFDVAISAIYRHVSEMNNHLVGRMNANAAYSEKDIAEAYEVYQEDLDEIIDEASVDELIENTSDLIGEYFNENILQPRREEEEELRSDFEYYASLVERQEHSLGEYARGISDRKSAYQAHREFVSNRKTLIEDAVSYELLPLDDGRVSIRIMNESDFPTARYQGPVTIRNDRISLNTYLNIERVMPGESVVTHSESGRMHWSSRDHSDEEGIEILREYGFSHGLSLVSDEQKAYQREYRNALSSNDGIIEVMEDDLEDRRASLDEMKSVLMEKEEALRNHEVETRRLMSVFGHYMG